MSGSAIGEGEITVRSDPLPLAAVENSVALAGLFRYWSALPRVGDLPNRRSFLPEEVPFVLADMALIQALDGGRDFLIRLAGDNVVRLCRDNLRGKLVSTVSPPEYAAEIAAHYRSAIATRLATLRTVNFEKNGIHASYVRLLLPLANDAGAVEWLLAASDRPALFAGEIEKILV